jgi:hypothetical protein
MKEQSVVDAVVAELGRQGFCVNTEVPNFYRSADVAAVDKSGDVWVIECKVSDISRAIQQARIHQLAADRVLVATPFRRTRPSTLSRLQDAGIGLMYVMPDGGIAEAYEAPRTREPWEYARDTLRRAIVEDAA